MKCICRKYGRVEEKTLVFYEGLVRLKVTTSTTIAAGSCATEEGPLVNPREVGISRQIA
jgi:hypothetical protein